MTDCRTTAWRRCTSAQPSSTAGWTSTRFPGRGPPCECWSPPGGCGARMADGGSFERDLGRLVAACEAGVDAPGVLAAAAEVARGALGAGTVSVYTSSEGGGELK